MSAYGEEKFVRAGRGPFEVFSSAGDKPVRETLNYLLQLRQAIGRALGKEEATSLWTIRVVIQKNTKPSASLALAGDYWVASIASGSPMSRPLVRELARVLIESNSNRMPPEIERGLADLYSTLDVQGTRVTLGAPPPASERTIDWARMHLISVHPDYSGKMGVLLRNLSQGLDSEPSWRNAFGKTRQEIDKEAQTWLARASFDTVALSGLAIDPERQFVIRPVEGLDAASLFAGKDHPEVEGARALLAKGDFAGAAKKNPRWAEPHFRMAEKETSPGRKLQMLKTAATLEPRNVAYWRTLAQYATEQKNFVEAAKAWTGAERAAATDTERAQLRKIRHDMEEQRAEFDETEKKRIADERARELQKLKDEAMNAVRLAEAKANQNLTPLEPGRKVEQWWDGPRPAGRVRGTLQRVDCANGRAKLVIVGDDNKTTQLLIAAPEKMVVEGETSTSLSCGPLKNPRTVVVEYHPKPDAKLGTAGDAAVIEFQKR